MQNVLPLFDMEAKIREVAPEVYQVYLPLPMRPSIVNVYLLKSGWEWALIDTGMQSAESMAALTAALATVGCPPVAIRKLLATHHHPDHFGASRMYKEVVGGEVYLKPGPVIAMASVTAGELRGTVLTPEQRGPVFIGKLGAQ